jgi:hypothetical protein
MTEEASYEASYRVIQLRDDVQTHVTPATIVIGDWIYLFFVEPDRTHIMYTKCKKAEVSDPNKWTEGKRISEKVSTLVAPSALWVDLGTDSAAKPVKMAYLIWASDEDHRIWAAKSSVLDASDLFHQPWYYTPFPAKAASLNGPGAFFVRDKTNRKHGALHVAYTDVDNHHLSLYGISMAAESLAAEWEQIPIDP